MLAFPQVVANFETFVKVVQCKTGPALDLAREGEALTNDPKYLKKLHVSCDASELITECYMRHLRQHLSRNARAVPSLSRAVPAIVAFMARFACHPSNYPPHPGGRHSAQKA